jgi:hypothetical protein
MTVVRTAARPGSAAAQISGPYDGFASAIATAQPSRFSAVVSRSLNRNQSTKALSRYIKVFGQGDLLTGCGQVAGSVLTTLVPLRTIAQRSLPCIAGLSL